MQEDGGSNVSGSGEDKCRTDPEGSGHQQVDNKWSRSESLDKKEPGNVD